jgi:uncharacterized protein with von Willebrand factor type A (vWA) domain
MMKIFNALLLSAVLMIIAGGCSTKDKAAESESASDSVSEQSAPFADESELSKKNYYLIFDGSGSMRGEKIKTAKEAVKRFIQLIPSDANIGLAAFDSNGSSERAALGSERDHILAMVDSISVGGATPLGASIDIAHGRFAEQGKKQRGYGEYNLVIITDGQATDGSRLTKAVDAILKKSPIVIHTIGFHIGSGHPLNQPGKIYYKTAYNFEELSQGLESVLAETEEFTVTEFKK